MQRDGRTATIPSWAQATFIVLLAGGAGLIGWSFAGPEPSGRRAGWPQEQALKYQAASARLHQLSLEAASEPGPDPDHRSPANSIRPAPSMRRCSASSKRPSPGHCSSPG